MMNSDVIEIYTDGACSGNPGPGGLGIVMKYKDQRKELAYGFKLTTNNRMELIAIIVALETLKKENSNVVVYSDSKYVVDSINVGNCGPKTLSTACAKIRRIHLNKARLF